MCENVTAVGLRPPGTPNVGLVRYSVLGTPSVRYSVLGTPSVDHLTPQKSLLQYYIDQLASYSPIVFLLLLYMHTIENPSHHCWLLPLAPILPPRNIDLHTHTTTTLSVNSFSSLSDNLTVKNKKRDVYNPY